MKGTVKVSLKELDLLRAKDLESWKFKAKVEEAVKECTDHIVQVEMHNFYHSDKIDIWVTIYPKHEAVRELTEKMADLKEKLKHSKNQVLKMEANKKWYEFWN